MALSVAGGGCWATGWPWLRVRSRSSGRLLLEHCLWLDSLGQWKKKVRVDLKGPADDVITFELWTGDSRSMDLLQFVTAWSVDLQRWVHSGAATRWYEVKTRGQRGVAHECEYRESVQELQRSAAYVRVSISGVGEPKVESSGLPQPDTTLSEREATAARKSTFQFVLPHRSLARSGKLRAVRVGQLVHELRTDVLHDLLPLTLYGRSNGGHRQRSRIDRPKEPANTMTKALILLQLSCQYASYCVGELDRHSNKLERRSDKCTAKMNRLKQRQHLLIEQKRNLCRESEVIGCSLDGMQSLLQELDPGTLAQLQSEYNLKLPTSKTNV